MDRLKGLGLSSLLIVFALGLSGLLTGCTEAERMRFDALGESARVLQFSGGDTIGRWCSTGRVESADSSDGYFFVPADGSASGVEVSGTVQIIPGHTACTQ